MRVVFHCNAGREYGMGHLMRCISLAEEAGREGWVAYFVGDIDSNGLEAISHRLGSVEVTGLARERQATHLREAIRALQPDVVHIDSYWLEADDLPSGSFLLSNMQDGHFGARRADIAIDANVGAENGFERRELSRYQLAGASAAIIRNDVRRERGRPATQHVPPQVLIVLGGTDPHGATAAVVDSLSDVEMPLRLTVVHRPESRDEIREIAGRGSHEVELSTFVADLPALARTHDIVVSAAGTSVWDFACMGVSMALVCVTANQLRGYAAAIEAGIAIGLGEFPRPGLRGAADRIAELLAAPRALSDLSENGRRTIDGWGAWRLVSSWVSLLEQPPTPVATVPGLTIRPATLADARALFDWRNDPQTRAASRFRGPLVWPEHEGWLRRTLADDRRALFVIELSGAPAGTIRYDWRQGVDWEVSISIAPSMRGRGIALGALLRSEHALESRASGAVRLIASIHQTNQASLRLFSRAGYLPHAPADEAGYLQVARLLAGAEISWPLVS